jgi:hypothetical protein
MKLVPFLLLLYIIISTPTLAQPDFNNKPVFEDYQKSVLVDLKVDFLQEKEIGKDNEIYRFSWLRSFDNPVVITLEKNGNVFILQYAIGKGNGSEDLRGIKKKNTLILSEYEWMYFKALIAKSSFDNLPNRKESLNMLDGNYWVLEHKAGQIYKGHSTREPDSLYALCCLYLLELTGEVYGKEDDASEYSRKRIYLNNKNEIVSKEEIIDSLIAHVNLFLKSNKIESIWCQIPDYIVTISTKGKLMSIKSIMGEGLYLDFLYFFEDRKCRRTYRKILKDIDLSGLNFKHDIRIYFDCDYDKEKNQLCRNKINCN